MSAHRTDARRSSALLDETVNPDDLDPLTTGLRAIAARLTMSDAQVVAGFLEEVLTTLTTAAHHPWPAKVL